MSFLARVWSAQGTAEQENLAPLPTEASTALAKSQAFSKQPAQLPTPYPFSQPLFHKGRLRRAD